MASESKSCITLATNLPRTELFPDLPQPAQGQGTERPWWESPPGYAGIRKGRKGKAEYSGSSKGQPKGKSKTVYTVTFEDDEGGADSDRRGEVPHDWSQMKTGLADRVQSESTKQNGEQLAEAPPEAHDPMKKNYVQLHSSEWKVLCICLGHMSEKEAMDFASCCAWYAPLLRQDSSLTGTNAHQSSRKLGPARI